MWCVFDFVVCWLFQEGTLCLFFFSFFLVWLALVLSLFQFSTVRVFAQLSLDFVRSLFSRREFGVVFGVVVVVVHKLFCFVVN